MSKRNKYKARAKGKPRKRGSSREVQREIVGKRDIRIQAVGFEGRLTVDAGDLRQLLLDIRDEDRRERHAKQPTFGELADSWYKRVARKRVCPENEERNVRHLSALHGLREHQLTKAIIEDALTGELVPNGGTLGPSGFNRLRGVGRLIVEDAQGNGLWAGINPFALVDRMSETEPFWATLTVEEACRLLTVLRPDRGRLVRTVLHVGPRPGEAFALRKTDVDLRNGMMRIWRSHERDSTKTGKARNFPIPDALVPVLVEAMERSPSELVFPGADGGQQGRNTRIAQYLARALGRAGIVSGFQYSCPTENCGHSETRPVREFAYCPKCEKLPLRVTGIARRFRFYDLRHTCASLLRASGCDPRVIQLVLGHAASNTTDAVYSHLSDDFVRRELNKLRIE